MKNPFGAEREVGVVKSQSARNSLWRFIAPFGVLFFLFGAGFAVLAGNLFSLESQLVESIALNDADAYTRALKEFRTLYTAEVVERVRPHGIEVTHDYRDRSAAIPLPATLSILLGNRLGDESETTVRLYSDYPFPWRVAEGGPKDRFEIGALQTLTLDSDKPYFRLEEREGRTILRYAIADQMRESCVDCHNNHPDSPKTNWTVGDVRGVLSITKPLAQSTTAVRQSIRISVTIMVGLAILAMVILGMVTVRHRRDALLAVQLAAETERANSLLAGQITERDRVETERRRLEEQMHQMQKLEQIGLLAGGIAHDFNNLLQSLLGNTELAMVKLNEDSEARAHLENAIDVASRASDLTHQLLVYAGRAPAKKHPFDLSRLVQEMGPLLKTVSGGRTSIKYQIGSRPLPTEGDRTQIQQVLLNLVTNAFDATIATGGRIRIRTCKVVLSREQLESMTFGVERPAGSYVLLEVEDDGCGMSEGLTNRIFDPFFSTKDRGRGLGLAMVSGIVLAHNGVMSVRTRVDEGTTFQVYFPETTKELPFSQPAEPAESSPIDSGLSVLVVDDEEGIRSALVDFFKTYGFSVRGAASGEDALRLFKETRTPFELVILDMRMPGMSGVETFKEMRALNPSITCILSSGDLPDSETQTFVDEGALWFIQKPYSFSALLERIQMARDNEH